MEIKIVMTGNWSRFLLLHKSENRSCKYILLQIFFFQCSLSEPERGSGPADRLPSLPATAYNSLRLNDCINSVMMTYNNVFLPLCLSIHNSVVCLRQYFFSCSPDPK